MAILGKKTEEKKAQAGEVSAAAYTNVPSVLVQPRISEKAGRLASMNKYVFKVKTEANKVEVKKAVEKTYKVKVVQVNMISNKGKHRNFAQRAGKTTAFKKAIVTLKQGDKIEGLTDVI